MKYRPGVFLLTIFVAFFLASTAIAGNLPSVTEFVSGDTATASGVNDVHNAIRVEVDGNADDISTNVGGISTNAADIATNVDDITAVDNGLTSHAGNSAAHHAEYTDGDAVNAVNQAGISSIAGNLMETEYTGRRFNIPIPAAGLTGTASSDPSTMTIPDVGPVLTISIHVKIELDRGTVSSDKRVELTDPDGTTHILYNGETTTGLNLTVTDTDIPSLASWIGRSPQNDWVLTVVDTYIADTAGGEPVTLDDGKVGEWSITFKGSGSPNDNTLIINKNLVVNGTIQSRQNHNVTQITKMSFSRSDGTTPVIYFTDAEGVRHTLPIPDPATPAINSHIAYQPSAAGDSMLLFNINSSPSFTCTLFSSEDDYPSSSKGLYWATDVGNNVGITIWPDRVTDTFALAKDATPNTIPILQNRSYSIVCL